MHFSLLLMIIMIASLREASGAFTVEQMRRIIAPLKKDCVEKTKADDNLVNGLREGKLVDNKELKCFLYCLYESIGTMTDGKLNLQNVMDGIDTYFPHDMKKDSISAFEKCKDVDHVDSCEAAFILSDCIVKVHPGMFFP